MTRTEANKIALGIMESRLQFEWARDCEPVNGKWTIRKLKLEGVRMRNAIATAVLQAWRDGVTYGRKP